MHSLKEVGIDFNRILAELENEGIKKFTDSYNTLIKHILVKSHSLTEKKEFKFSGANVNMIDFSPELEKMNFVKRLWEKDCTLWKDDSAHAEIIKNSLGWLKAPYEMQVAKIENFARSVRRFKYAVLLGMGGSSLAPAVLASLFQKSGWPKLFILDTTDPREISAVRRKIQPSKTLFIYSSKSGGTIEPKSQFNYFYSLLKAEKVKNPGKHFIAITDKGTCLERLATEKNFRKIFINPPDIGGRFSALSYFGLVPAAICGASARDILKSAAETANLCKNESIQDNPGALLGSLLGGSYLQGLDKMTLTLPDKMEKFGLWVEQLIAESLGKEGKGVVPICGEKLSSKTKYQADRFFINLNFKKRNGKTVRELNRLSRLGHPVLQMQIKNLHDIGGEFFKWEVATAAAGALMKINPFDQPNVQEAKSQTMNILAEISRNGHLPALKSDFENENFSVFLSTQMKKFLPYVKKPESIFNSIFSALSGKEYIALLAYFPYKNKIEEILCRIKETFKTKFYSATLFGYGPRYLHSSGQLHKGGPDNAIFIILTCMPTKEEDLKIPDEVYTFAHLEAAQARGDFMALSSKNRRAIWLDLKKPLQKNVEYMYTALRDVNKLTIHTSGGGRMMKLAVRKKRTTNRTTTPRTTETKTNEYVVIDYPQQLETINSRHYTFRIGTSNCHKVEISINDQPWQPCRYSAGYWWYDWNGYTPGNYTTVARITTPEGKYLISKKRRFKVTY